MLNEKDIKIAKELKEKVSKIVDVVDFRIFGSRARGDADEYSDFDVFIEVEDINKEKEDKIDDLSWELGYNNDDIVICPLVYTRQEIENSALRASHIVRNIMEEGVRI